MALLDAMGARLVASSVGTLGTNIFLAQLQDTPDAAVVVMELSGGEPLYVFGTSVSAVQRSKVKVVCRAAKNDYPAGKTLAEACRTSIGSMRNVTGNSVTVLSALDATGVYPLSYDGLERPLLACDFAVTWF